MLVQGHPSSLEAMAYRKALSLAQDLGMQNLHIASDCNKLSTTSMMGQGETTRVLFEELEKRLVHFLFVIVVMNFGLLMLKHIQ